MSTLSDPLSQQYLDWCRQEGIPPNTVRRRRSTLALLGNAGTATREDLEQWWATRSDKAPATRAADLANLRTFYAWCRIWEHREDDPTGRLSRPKVSTGMPRAITETDLDTVLTTYRTADPIVFRAAVLAADAGLRAAETARLTWDDIDQVNHHITVLGKGGKIRRLPVQPSTLHDLGPAQPSSVSVVTGTLSPYTPDQLRQRVNRAMRRVGVSATFHQLRHRFGTLAYRAEQDLVAVSRLMGHASIETTKVYAAAADDQALRIFRAIAEQRRQLPTPDGSPPDA